MFQEKTLNLNNFLKIVTQKNRVDISSFLLKLQ